ncbi:MAG: DUF1987 domain-containing protein [Bacteroidales bacterium]|nr:DUF1987 domain-containing protein [Bacteroidales bacterium]
MISMETGRIFIMGRSIPENPGDYYRPVHAWITEYSQNHIEKSRIDLGFEYINTSSTKWIFNILKELSEMEDVSENVKVTWYYEQGDEDMCELGFILKSLIECPFILVEVEEMNTARYEWILTTDNL